MTEQPKLPNPQFRFRMFRLFLRSIPIPFLPLPELLDVVNALKRSRTDLDQQVTDAIESLHHSSELVSRLEDGLKERSIRLDKLREEHERYSRLAEIEEKKVEALVQQLEITLGKGRGRERLIALGLNFIVGLLFFVAGILLSGSIQAWLKSIF